MTVLLKRPLVSLLGTACSPAAICWFVISICIDAIERMTFWGWSHIGPESLEGTKPLIANTDTTTAVVGKDWGLRIQAPLFHVAPCLMFWSFRESVNSRTLNRALNFQASAAPRVSESEVMRTGDVRAAATTATQPFRGWRVGRLCDPTNDGQSADGTASQIIEALTRHMHIIGHRTAQVH